MTMPKQPQASTSISLRARDWTLRTDNAPTGSLVSEINPMPLKPAGFWFNFPGADAPGWSVDYLTTGFAGPVTAERLLFAFTIAFTDGAPVFFDPDNDAGGLPPNVGPLFIHANGNDRWWHITRHILNPGAFDVDALLWPTSWTNQNGQPGNTSTAPGSFLDTLQNLGRVGLTFGAGDDYGHGVSTRGGTARFTLNDAAFL